MDTFLHLQNFTFTFKKLVCFYTKLKIAGATSLLSLYNVTDIIHFMAVHEGNKTGVSRGARGSSH